MQTPFITVIMPVYNAEKYLDEAIQSILNQTFTNFEFLIFNDCSKDSSWQIIQKYAQQDPRIVAFDSPINQGYVAHLNEGIKIAKGKYIARMDNDDASLPQRFEKQVQYLENHPEVVMCGCWFKSIGVRNDVVELPYENEHVRLQFLHNNVFSHPSVMMRLETLKQQNLLYDKTQMPSEDYLMWTSLAMVGNVVNIPEVLFAYRFHAQNFSNSAWKEAQQQKFAAAQIRYRKFFFRQFNFTEAQHQLLHLFFDKKLGNNLQELQEIVSLLNFIKQNYQDDTVSKKALLPYLDRLFYYLCTTSTHLGWEVLKLYFGNSLKVKSLSLNLKLVLKALFRYKVVHQ